jgi:hypothetical protein
MTAECGGTTARNGQQHFDVLPAEPLAISFDEGSSLSTKDIIHTHTYSVQTAVTRRLPWNFVCEIIFCES